MRKKRSIIAYLNTEDQAELSREWAIAQADGNHAYNCPAGRNGFPCENCCAKIDRSYKTLIELRNKYMPRIVRNA